jgi:hypothetical protein
VGVGASAKPVGELPWRQDLDGERGEIDFERVEVR